MLSRGATMASGNDISCNIFVNTKYLHLVNVSFANRSVIQCLICTPTWYIVECWQMLANYVLRSRVNPKYLGKIHDNDNSKQLQYGRRVVAALSCRFQVFVSFDYFLLDWRMPNFRAVTTRRLYWSTSTVPLRHDGLCRKCMVYIPK